jgi:hypothetical protein
MRPYPYMDTFSFAVANIAAAKLQRREFRDAFEIFQAG